MHTVAHSMNFWRGYWEYLFVTKLNEANIIQQLFEQLSFEWRFSFSQFSAGVFLITSKQVAVVRVQVGNAIWRVER